MMGEVGALPMNLDAERYVLGSVLLDDTLFTGLVGALQTDDFSVEKHRRMFNRMGELHERGERIDRITLANELEKQNQLESVDGLGYLVSLDDGLPQIANLDSYVRIVQEKAVLRRLAVVASKIEAQVFAGEEGPQAILDGASQMLSGLQPGERLKRPISTGALVEECSVDNLLSPTRERALSIRFFPGLDRLLCGLQPEQLVLLAGHTSTGKTSLALQIAVEVATQSGVCYFSLEMEPRRLFRRMVVQRAKVAHDLLRRGELDGEQRRLCLGVAEWLKQQPLWLDERSHTVAAIIAAVRKVRLVQPVGLVVVDYLQLLSSAGRYDSRAREVSANNRALKLAAQEFGIPFLVLSQFSRESAKAHRPAQLYDLKESGDIENDADVVLLIRPDPAQPEGEVPRLVDLYLAKQREGPRNIHVPMQFWPAFQRFEECA
jgi:replicative DNA helicase